MMRRVFILFGAALLLLSGAACRRIEAPSGSVTLTFRVGEPATRAETPGDGNIADGGGISCTKEGDTVIPDLHIFIADGNGNIIKHFPPEGEVSESDYADGKATLLSVVFNFADKGEGYYSVYAIANPGTAGGNLQIPDLTTGLTTVSDLEALQLSMTDADAAPATGNRMLLSAKGTLNVVKGLGADKYNGHVELQMLRPVAKVQLSFKNLTQAPLSLYNCQVKFHDMNAAMAWVFPTDPDFVAGTYRNFTSPATVLINIPSTDDSATDEDEREKPAFGTPMLFFPSVAPMQSKPTAGKRYLCDISFRIAKEGKTYNAADSETYEEKSFTDLPIHDRLSQDILALGRNQYLQIITTISKGNTVSFNFIVNNWVGHHETVFFN